MEKLGIGIIGLGYIAGWHAPSYLENERAEIVAVCDVKKEVSKKGAKFWGVDKWYTDYKNLLKDDHVDAVDVLLPHHLHAKVVVDAAEAGKHVAVQKPIALNIKDADRMIDATRKANVKFMVEECEMFYPPYEKAKELIETGEIGEPNFIRIGYRQGRMMHPPIIKWKSRFGPADWRRDPRKFGGSHFFTAGHHKFAVARYLMGEIAEVRAWIDDIKKPNHYPFVAMWRYTDRWKYGTFDYTFSRNMLVKSDHGPMAATLDVTGSNGMIWVINCEAQTLRVAPLILYQSSGKSLHFENLEVNYHTVFKAMTNNFVEGVLEDKEPRVNGEEGKKILQFSLALYKSAENKGKNIRPESIKEWSWPWERDPSFLQKIDMSYGPSP